MKKIHNVYGSDRKKKRDDKDDERDRIQKSKTWERERITAIGEDYNGAETENRILYRRKEGVILKGRGGRELETRYHR